MPASRIARLVLDVDRILSEGSVMIHNVYVANGSPAPVEVVFLDNDDNPILNMICPSLDSDNFRGDWIADNGLKVSGLADGDVIVAILHTSEGS